MDIFSEGSRDSRVLAARHISEKPIPKMDNAINTTLLCHSYTIQPDFGTYLAVIRLGAMVRGASSAASDVCAVCLHAALSASALEAVLRQCWRRVGCLVSTAAFLAVVLPRARLLAEAIAQEVVMIAMYHLYSMIIAECGGADQFNIGWCSPGDESAAVLLLAMLRHPEAYPAERLYLSCFTYIQPFIAASILSGVWGVVMTVRAAATAGRNIRPRFLALQLVLLIVKLQCGFAKVLPEIAHLPCIVPLNPSVFTNTARKIQP
ncbi:Organic solute transporter alpha-like protein [Operophtera brumata]|uniref:Organic solute transporter alpha-like protein n=1 Tax=Operophtera brumata TaxID=104452 RepID=A0A0L7LC73_OPEBR|nr:Organic solute transporter alpha-like protein [Operophtera brumata]